MQLFGRTIGLNFKDRGQIGVKVKLYIFLCIIGPFNTILLDTEPNELDITIPSPHSLLINIGVSSTLFLKYNSILISAGFAPRLI